MVDNIGRKLTLIFTLVGVSILLLVLPEEPFRMGLDLKGGTRLVYSFDFKQAYDDEVLAADEPQYEVLQQQIQIIRERVDPTGVLDPVIRAEGDDRVVIELPGTASTLNRPRGSLAAPIGASADSLTIQTDEISAFPEADGIVSVGLETIAYREREGDVLTGLTRGLHGAPADHEAGEELVLVSGDPIQNRIESLGDLSFMILALDGDLADTDMTTERTRMGEWLDANPGRRLVDYNQVAHATGGPHPQLSWYPLRVPEGDVDTGERNRAVAVLNQQRQEWTFRGDALGRVYYTFDELGYPAVGFEMKPQRRANFSDFTGANVGRNLAIVLNDVVYSSPNLEQRLSGSSIIRGRFTDEEVRDLVTVLRTGSLRLRPTLEQRESVGPTLGADYVRRGLLSGVLGLLAVLAFMIVYYRRLGIYSAISLFATMLMLMGGMAFLQATLTLPGIAGIILTVGMAVDANILIFDRLREETEKGRNIKQAAKNGFQHATSAILDANITSFLTAFILYQMGTGPVRGFAVTLMVGIVVSVFSALVITRVLVHYALEKGVRAFPMGAWLARANFKFLDKWRVACAASALFIVAGLFLFASLPDTRKLGIDFLGGDTTRINTEQPQTTDEIRLLVGNLETQGVRRSLEVKPVLDSGVGDGRYTEFRITYKKGSEPAPAPGASGDEAAVVDKEFRNLLEEALSPVLAKGPVALAENGITTTEGVTTATFDLYFLEGHPEVDVVERLGVAGIREPQVEPGPVAESYRVTGKLPAAMTPLALNDSVVQSFQGATDSNQVAYTLKEPIPETTVVGEQVVGELRDSAILAILVSLFVVVMYIRVRFAEYSYGFAAVTAILHDVLVTIGVLAILMQTTDLAVEISLPMIAAFLTIIGYSLNDTIVIFDRVRENLPRSAGTMSEIIDTSINQTLSRTIMTSTTTLIAVALLFAFNVGTGNVLEGFSLAMICGILVGTYSTIFIASPLLAALESRRRRRAGAPDALSVPAPSKSTTV